MPIDLNDEDLATINRLSVLVAFGDVEQATVEEIYRAALAAGRARAIEEAAQMCEVQGRLWAMHPAKSNNDVRKKEARRDEAYSLATALRALNAPAASATEP